MVTQAIPKLPMRLKSQTKVTISVNLALWNWQIMAIIYCSKRTELKFTFLNSKHWILYFGRRF